MSTKRTQPGVKGLRSAPGRDFSQSLALGRSVRLYTSQEEEIKRLGLNRTQVIRDAVTAYLKTLDNRRKARAPWPNTHAPQKP